MPINKAIMDTLKHRKLETTVSRIRAGVVFKIEKNAAVCEQRVWKYISRSLPPLEKTYDIAIGYLEKNPIYFCVDKVKAKMKIGFIHNDYEKLAMDPTIDKKYFSELNHIVTVSEECAKVLKNKFPTNAEKVKVMYNIVSDKTIHKMAMEPVELNSNNNNNNSKILVSVGRLNYQKGFDLAVKACKYLVDSGYSFKWYVIGEGEERRKLEELIKQFGVENYFILLGMKENPYPYVKAADIYVQPSRFEGKSIAIDEAKILLKPIVVTNFSTVKDQIIHNVNGLIVDMNSIAIFEGIKSLIVDNELKAALQKNLSKEKLGSESEIEKLYQMFEAI
jgi:glycosyltransferase involved in cell wall biosynthesis